MARSAQQPVVVEVSPAEAPEPELEVRFTGRNDWDMLRDLDGGFVGPIRAASLPTLNTGHAPHEAGGKEWN